MKCGIYAIFDNTDGKCLYVGQSVHIVHRFYTHRFYLRNGKHPNSGLQCFYQQKGLSALKFEIIEECQKELLDVRERAVSYTLKPKFYLKTMRTRTAEWKKTNRNHTEYSVWKSMISRCYNSNRKCFKNYGGRGIVICDRWRKSFKAFLQDVGPRPSKKHSLDRINNDGNYEPGNCRWATSNVQTLNRRNTKWIMFRGEKHTLHQWAKILNISPTTIRRRLRLGLSVERAFSERIVLENTAFLNHNAVRHIRVELGLTLQDAANRYGRSKSLWCMMETGYVSSTGQTRIKTIQKIADVLGVKMSDIICTETFHLKTFAAKRIRKTAQRTPQTIS